MSRDPGPELDAPGPAEASDLPGSGGLDSLLERVYAQGARFRRRRYLVTATSSIVGLLSIGLVVVVTMSDTVPTDPRTDNAVLSSAATLSRSAPGSDNLGPPQTEPGALSTSTADGPLADGTASGPGTASGLASDAGTEIDPASPSSTAAVPTPAGTQPAPGPSTTLVSPTASEVPGAAPTTTSSAPATTTASRPAAGEAQRVSPTPGIVDLRPQRFEAVAPNGSRTLAVRYWSGPEPCSVLGRVDVEESGSDVVITLWVGRPESAGPDLACIAIAVSYETIVQLEHDLGPRHVIDGALAAA